jgi:hypothetical protein
VEVDETADLIDFVAVCRIYASELAVKEVTLRTFSDLQHYVEHSTEALLQRCAAPTRAPRVPSTAGQGRDPLLRRAVRPRLCVADEPRGGERAVRRAQFDKGGLGLHNSVRNCTWSKRRCCSGGPQ